jgi:hypothetical protein
MPLHVDLLDRVERRAELQLALNQSVTNRKYADDKLRAVVSIEKSAKAQTRNPGMSIRRCLR